MAAAENGDPVSSPRGAAQGAAAAVLGATAVAPMLAPATRPRLVAVVGAAAPHVAVALMQEGQVHNIPRGPLLCMVVAVMVPGFSQT